MGENSKIAPSQLAHELKKQKETLILEFAEIMSESMVEMKEMIRINQQESSVQEFHFNLRSSIPNASLQSRLSSASASASTCTAQETNQMPLFLPNYKFPKASTVREVLQSHDEANPEKGTTCPLKSMTQEENRQHPKTSKKVSW